MTQETNNPIYDTAFRESFDIASPYQHCLIPLLNALGWLGHARDVVEALPHFIEKLGHHDFLDVMASLHYQHESCAVSLDYFDDRLAPCLFVAATGEVMVILKRCEESRKLLVFDGSINQNRYLDHTQFQGECLFFKRQSESSEIIERDKNWVSATLKKNKGLIIEAGVLTLFTNLMVAMVPLFVMSIYDRVITTGSVSLLSHLVIGACIVFAGIFTFSNLRADLFSTLAARLDNQVGSRLFRHIIQLPSKSLEGTTVGAQVARIKEFETLREFFTSASVGLLFDFPFAILYLFVIAGLAGNLVFVPLSIFLFYYLLTISMKRYTHENIEATAIANSKRQEFMIETFHNLQHIKCASAISTWKDRYRKQVAKAALSNYRSSVLISVTQAISDAFVILTGTAILVFGIIKVLNGEITTGALIAVMILSWRLLGPVNTFFAMLPRLDQLWSSVKQMNLLMNITTENHSNSHYQHNLQLEGRVTFKNVSIRFETYCPPALLNTSFDIPAGELVAIAGGNGSGKSLLLKMLLRIYQSQSGSISIDGKDIRQFDAGDLRHAISYVPQTTHFFYGTIKQNLRLAHPLASEEDMINVAKVVGIYDDLVRLPEGLETRLRDGSEANLSGNFKQRLSLARALIKPTQILLLDELFDIMDVKTQESIMQYLQSLRGKKTILYVVHQHQFLKYADRIIFMQSGKVLFNGSPKEGLARLQGMKQ